MYWRMYNSYVQTSYSDRLYRGSSVLYRPTSPANNYVVPEIEGPIKTRTTGHGERSDEQGTSQSNGTLTAP